MGEITDPSIIAAYDAAPDAPPQEQAAPKEITDPGVIAQYNAVPAGGGGASGEWQAPQDKLPFGDQVALGQASNFEEKELYMQNRYGKGNVSREWGDDGKPALLVKTTDGKTFRLGGDKDTSFVAQVAADSPRLGGMMVGGAEGAELGATYGSALGPEGTIVGGVLGGIVGAGVGAFVGQGAIEGSKAIAGNYDKSPAQLGRTMLDANNEGETAELGGRVAGRVIKEVGSAHLPRFITGATADSDKLTKQAWDAGARPGSAAYAPDMRKLHRVESLTEKTVGRAHYQDKRNMAYVKQAVKETLKGSGNPDYYVDSFMSAMDDPAQQLSHNGIGEHLQASVQAHVASLNAAVDRASDASMSHVTAQLKNLESVIDSSKEVDLADRTGKMLDSALDDFKKSSSDMYDTVMNFVGSKPVVPMNTFAKPAEKLVAAIRESKVGQIPQIIQKMSQQAGRELSERDALLLNEFGVEVPDGGKMSLQGAQRVRTQLQNLARGGTKELHSVSEHDFGVMADAMDDAIKESYSNPAVAPVAPILQKADAFYADGINKFKDVEVKKLFKLARAEYPLDAEGVVSILTRPGYSSRTSELRKVIGEDTWRGVQSAHMQKFLGNYVERDGANRPAVDGLKMLQDMRSGRAMETFQAVHGKESLAEMRELAQLAAAHKGEFPIDQVTKLGPRAALESMKSAIARRDAALSDRWVNILADGTKTGEEAYQFVAAPGAKSEANLMKAAKIFGVNSPQMKGLRQAALEHVARNANIEAVSKAGNQPIEKALSAYTPNQIKLLFPDGLATDLRRLSDVIKFMYKKESGATADATAPSLAAGLILSAPFFARIPIQATGAVMRMMILHPAFAKFITIGHNEGEPWLKRTAALFEKMTQMSTAEAMDGDNNQTSQQAATQAAPGQQTAMSMPGPATIQ